MSALDGSWDRATHARYVSVRSVRVDENPLDQPVAPTVSNEKGHQPSLRILQVNAADRGGGAEAVALTLHRAFLERGHQSRLGVGRVREGGPGIFRVEQGHGLAWRLHERLDLAMRFRAARLARALTEPGTVLDACRGHEDFRFPGAYRLLDDRAALDILQLHNLHGGYFDLRALPLLAARVPVIATLHDAWMLTGHCAHSFDCERWTSGCGSCPYLDTYPALHHDGTAFNLHRKAAIFEATSMSVVTPSRWLMDMVDRSVLAPAAARRRVIPNGVDLSVFHPHNRHEARRSLGIADGRLLLVAVSQGGQDNPFRDARTFTDALERLGAADGEPVDVVALGEADDSVRSLGRVTLRGVRHVPAETLRLWLNAADAYVHSARADTFPTSVLEALACGAPVVASSVGGIPEQVRALGDDPDPTGVLVAPGDPTALALALDRVMGDAALRRRLGENAAADAQRRFSLDEQVAAYLEFYEELLESRRAGGA